jgi:hypothetical protein
VLKIGCDQIIGLSPAGSFIAFKQVTGKLLGASAKGCKYHLPFLKLNYGVFGV